MDPAAKVSWPQRVLARWWVCGVLFAISMVIFSNILPKKIAIVTANGTRGTKLLDEHIMTWTPGDAVSLMTSLGSSGREAYVHFYLTFDFYFPALISSLMMISLLMLLLANHRRLMILAYTPAIAYLCDFFENTTNLLISSSWPAQPVVLWTLGPVWTFCKWSAIFISLGLIAMAAMIRIGDIFATRYNRTPGTARLE